MAAKQRLRRMRTTYKQERDPQPGRLYIHPLYVQGYFEENTHGDGLDEKENGISVIELRLKNVVELKAPLPPTEDYNDDSPAFLVGQVLDNGPNNIKTGHFTVLFPWMLSIGSLYENLDFDGLKKFLASYNTKEEMLQPGDWRKLKQQIVELTYEVAKPLSENHNAQNLSIIISAEIKTVKVCEEEELIQRATKRACNETETASALLAVKPCYGEELTQRVMKRSCIEENAAVASSFEGGLKVNKFHKEELTEGPCSVCLDAFFTGGNVQLMHCSYIFHQECILHWLLLKKTCPICRFKVR